MRNEVAEADRTSRNTGYDAAAPPQTQAFALVGTLILLPVVLGYTAVTYYVFRGKVRTGEGYH